MKAEPYEFKIKEVQIRDSNKKQAIGEDGKGKALHVPISAYLCSPYVWDDGGK